jgi:hypothetical protein
MACRCLGRFGTRTIADEQQDGCFLTFHVSGLLISSLKNRVTGR